MSSSGVLIVGGYGHVGSQIATRLTEAGVKPVRIAGRDAQKASLAAARIGCEAAMIDLASPASWDDALEGVRCVVVCVDQENTDFAAAVMGRGLIYIDITADDSFFRAVEALAPSVTQTGGRAVLSVGLAPGLTNLLVKACAANMSAVDSARIGILLGIGDEHGPAAIDWTLRAFRKAGAPKVETMDFGSPARPHPAIPFDFADQHIVRRTMGIPDARTVLTFDTPFLRRVMFALMRPVAASPILSRWAKSLMPRLHVGSDRTALSIEVTGMIDGRRVTQGMVLEGHREASITAAVAAILAQHVLEHDVPEGIHHIEQVMSLEHFSDKLALEGVTITATDN